MNTTAGKRTLVHRNLGVAVGEIKLTDNKDIF